jgi:transcriptional regulator with XRE-family HTH domain
VDKFLKYENKMAEKRILNRIKSALADHNKTNLWLAEALGKNKSTVSKWCTNDQQPTLDTLFDIAEVLGVDVAELLVTKTKK